MECQDCAKKEATTLVWAIKEQDFFVVCDNCIKRYDKVCPSEYIRGLQQ